MAWISDQQFQSMILSACRVTCLLAIDVQPLGIEGVIVFALGNFVGLIVVEGV